MTDHNPPGTKNDELPLARRLRAVGFIVNDLCVRPTPERLGELHLHANDACTTPYCVACDKPLYALTEIVPNEPVCEHDSTVDASDLCLVCAHCGVIYDTDFMHDGSGVLCHLVVERANLIEALSVFDGVPSVDRAHVALAHALDEQEARLKQGLESVSKRRAGLTRGEPTTKGPTALKVVRDPSAQKGKGAKVRSLRVVGPSTESDDSDPDPEPPAPPTAA